MKKLALWCAGLLASTAAAASNALTEVTVTEAPHGVAIRVQCAEPPVFNVFRLKEPDRLVVDVSQASVIAIEGHHGGLGPATGVLVSQFREGNAEVGRMLIGLRHASKYDVKADGKNLIVSIDADESAAPARAEAPAVAPHKVAKRLMGVVSVEGGIKLSTDGEVSKVESLELENPPRLVIDLMGVKGSPKLSSTSIPGVREVRVGPHADKARVVLEFATMPTFELKRRADGVVVSLSRTSKPAELAEAAEVEIDGVPMALENSVPVAKPVAQSRAEINDVTFRESDKGGVVELKLKGTPRWSVERPDAKSAVLNVEGAVLARRLEKSLDTSALDTPVKMVSVFAVPGSTPRARIVVAGGQALEQELQQRQGTWTWHLRAAGSTDSRVAKNASAGFSTEAVAAMEEGAPQQRSGYIGKRVSFEFKDIDIHNFLRVIAELSKKNIVVADDVTGKITVRLRNVPWDQALDLALRSKGLGKEEFGNIIRVAPLDKLEAEAKARAERVKSQQEATPLVVSLIPVNYAKADDMAGRVKEILSGRGNVTVDIRTNTLIVRDLPDSMPKVRSLVASLDLQTPQVLIESRIVEASTSFNREVGIQWGGQGLMSGVTGNPTGLVFPSSVAVTGAAVEPGSAGNPSPANYAVSLPVGATTGSGGALGLAFGSAGGAAQLNLRLSALEAQGTVKTISAPKVTTMDNATARISQGVSIPFSQVSAAGTNTQFVEARLALEVTPHITQDGSVMMNIRAENNQPDPSNRSANGQPGIARKEATTNVLVKDGETTVIGGIYVRAGSNSQSGIPLLSKIPVLGFFFRSTAERETKNELLIFVTPRILNRSTVAQNP